MLFSNLFIKLWHFQILLSVNLTKIDVFRKFMPVLTNTVS